MTRTLLLALVLAPLLAQAAPPELHEVPAALRVDPAGVPLDDAQRQALSDRKVLAQLVNDGGPEPWPGVAVAILDGSPRQVFAVLRDYPHFPEYMPYVQSATVVEHAGKRWLVDYVIKGPMGIGDRQYQLEVFDEEETRDGVTVLVSRFRYTGKGNIKSTQGTWKLVPLWDGKTTFARYEVRTDPGGSFTVWLKRKIAASGLPKVIESVRKRLTKNGENR
jgi:hypothetical protein